MADKSALIIEYNQIPSPLPFYGKILFRAGAGDKPRSVRPIICRLGGLQFSRRLLGNYSDMCDWQYRESVPILFPHTVLGPLHLAMLTHKEFRLNLLGSVHLRNHLIQYQPLDPAGTYDVELRLETYRRRPKGIEFDLETTLKLANDPVWVSVSTFFVRSAVTGEDEVSPLSQVVEDIGDDAVERFAFDVNGWTGKKFGLLSKDINPIHMSSVLAKIFGFKRDLVHGMWSLARVSSSLIEKGDMAGPLRIDALFKGPIYMKDRVRILTRPTDTGHFACFSGDNPRPSIVGKIANVERSAKI
jgi:hypothetical protein